MWVEAILPARMRTIGAKRALVTARMNKLTADMQRVAMNYEPPPTPTYRRTMALSKSWSRKVRFVGGDLVGEVRSSHGVAPYNVYVRGPRSGPGPGRRQAAHMARRGWLSVDNIMERFWPDAQADFIAIFTSGR